MAGHGPHCRDGCCLLALVVTRPVINQPITNQSISNQAIGNADIADDGWMMVADLVGPIDLDSADAAGLSITPGTAELAALELNAQEQQELRRLLRAELERVKS